MQFDADTVGSATPAADAEICMMAADTMEALGIARGSYVVKVNNRKVLDGVMESIELGGEENAARRLTVLRAIDKLDKFPISEVEKLLGPGRWDGGEEGKGDFTKGAELSEKDAHAIATCFGDPVHADDVAFRYLFESDAVANARDELDQISKLVTAAGYGADRIKIDPSVVRGLEYYTGPVYEVELLLETKDEKGRPVRFGSVGGGGRYDGLVSRFRGEPVPATGFSIGVSRLQAALTLLGKLDTRPEFGPVVVTVFDRDRVADYQKMVAALRTAGIRAELYLGNPKNMGNQLKYADRRNSPCVIIQGSDEKARGELQIKDLIEGAKAAAAIASNQEWRETRPAQFSCSEADLVAKVREVLARHDVTWG
jgi:histidyl-tRNA synthetase